MSGMHVGIIMDGNGRWARSQGKPRWRGHLAGVDSVRDVVRGAPDLGISTLTMYAFSSDNWKRPRGEVSRLFWLLREFCRRERAELIEKLKTLKDPDTGQAVCNKVMKREEVFSGNYADRAPDIIIDPHDGYDLKARLGEGELFERGVLNGMHTYSDAMLLAGKGLEKLAAAGNITEAGAHLARHFLA